MKCLLWTLLGPPILIYLGVLAPLFVSMIFGGGFEMDRPLTAFEKLVDSFVMPLIYILPIGGVLYSLRKAYLTLRDG